MSRTPCACTFPSTSRTHYNSELSRNTTGKNNAAVKCEVECHNSTPFAHLNPVVGAAAEALTPSPTDGCGQPVDMIGDGKGIARGAAGAAATEPLTAHDRHTSKSHSRHEAINVPTTHREEHTSQPKPSVGVEYIRRP